MLAPGPNTPTVTHSWRDNAPALAALVVAVAGAATIAGAWFFELVIGLKPCPMCLEQRWPYYIGIPLALLVALAAWRKAPRMVVAGGLLVLAGLMVWSTYMGVFHSGVEWKWWDGPQACSGAATFGPSSGFLKRLGVNQHHALRRSGVAIPRAFAGRLQRADLGRAGADRAVGCEEAYTP